MESRAQLLETAEAVRRAGGTMLRGGAYKPRTSPYAFQGLGQEGLRLLAEAGTGTREIEGLLFSGTGEQLDISQQSLVLGAEQSNTSVLYGNKLIMKVYRRVEEGMNPDLEVGLYLTDVAHFPHTAPVVGAVEFRRKRKAEPITLKVADIDTRAKSPISAMPKGLLDKLTRDEILDLVAYLTARGNRRHPLFRAEEKHEHGH